jgi:hypothetical protein
MTNWNFTAVGAASIDRDLCDRRYFERRFRRIGEEDPLPLLAPKPAPTNFAPAQSSQRAAEPELLIELRRHHEAGHALVAHHCGLIIEELCAISGRGHCSWRIPDDEPNSPQFQRAHMVALAGGWSAMRKFGCRSDNKFYKDRCGVDDRRLGELARRHAPEAPDQLIAQVRAEADRIIDARWSDIQSLAAILPLFGDEIGERSLQIFLKHVPRGDTCDQIRHRRCFISNDWQRRGLARPNFDAESREVDAVLSTGMAVRREDWDGPFLETLGMKPENVRMGRLNQGAMVLDSHRWHEGLSATLGGIVPGSARVANGELTARIKFSRGSDLAQRITKDLADGIQIPLSIGYKIHHMVDDRSTTPPTRLATDWEPLEVSLVPVAADTGTGFRTAA